MFLESPVKPLCSTNGNGITSKQILVIDKRLLVQSGEILGMNDAMSDNPINLKVVILEEVESWMNKMKIETVEDFKTKSSPLYFNGIPKMKEKQKKLLAMWEFAHGKNAIVPFEKARHPIYPLEKPTIVEEATKKKKMRKKKVVNDVEVIKEIEKKKDMQNAVKNFFIGIEKNLTVAEGKEQVLL